MDTQDTQRDTVMCCGLAAEEQVFSRIGGLAVWSADLVVHLFNGILSDVCLTLPSLSSLSD